jgi:hypothetical protein
MVELKKRPSWASSKLAFEGKDKLLKRANFLIISIKFLSSRGGPVSDLHIGQMRWFEIFSNKSSRQLAQNACEQVRLKKLDYK